MPVISRIWARSALISAGLQPQQENWNPATGQRNWLTHPAVPPGTDDQNSTPARELEPPQPLLRSLDGGQHPCAKIGANGWPWGWRPEQLERWVAEGRWAHSTVRSY